MHSEAENVLSDSDRREKKHTVKEGGSKIMDRKAGRLRKRSRRLAVTVKGGHFRETVLKRGRERKGAVTERERKKGVERERGRDRLHVKQ